ncbi:MAG: phytanoyl-CoA dioxygenase family protein [Actinomycetota bacterium]
MDLDEAADRWRADGFVVLPSFLDERDLASAVAELGELFPSADDFLDDVDPARNARYRSEFGGIVDFPFAGVELSLLAVNPRLIGLVETLLGTADVRMYSAEAWAKYTGAARYDQAHHRDYLNHTLLAPSDDPAFGQVELFLYLVDVPTELGPPALVRRDDAGRRPALPNWYPRSAGPPDAEFPTWRSTDAHPELYDVEVPAHGPAGTVVAYSPSTFHRGTELTRPRGARFTLHCSFRSVSTPWAGRRSWVEVANDDAWHAFVARATPRQLALFGVPPPGHRYWTAETLEAVGLRYPTLDLTPWRVLGPDAAR